ncbi:zinc-binding dehydrogenase [Actinomadura sp. 6K520]|uniref:zinc-binding dehydrogenase n=1 Tax=Actinomadura sp. 6K520 TaxID=2530364 RepID=UPI00104E4C9E|nr:zinc-binding dehydrogenase [Actinomadura sp. 6K520]TDE32144.1 alcohol dehydrogenase [Actinomadura sp. 6K520]
MTTITARAAVLHEPGKPMTIQQISLREPGPGEVLVRTATAGICGTDLHFAAGRFPYPVPTVLGHEASGVIEQTGPDVPGLQPGDRVLVCDQIPCGRCGNCLAGRMVYCTDNGTKQRQRARLSLGGQNFRQFLGVSALAERMLVDTAALIALPDQISFAAGALLGCCLTTGAATIINTAHTRPGDTVLIIGCGGVGLGAVQAAHIAGAARIIAADPEPHRAQAALDLGATDVIDPTITDLTSAVAAVTEHRGVDVAVEAVGDVALAEAAFAALAPGGRAIVVGMMPSDSCIALPSELVRHGRSMAGSVMGEVRTRHDIPVYLQMAASGRLTADDLATSTWPLNQINDAFANAAARHGIRTMIEF